MSWMIRLQLSAVSCTVRMNTSYLLSSLPSPSQDYSRRSNKVRGRYPRERLSQCLAQGARLLRPQRPKDIWEGLGHCIRQHCILNERCEAVGSLKWIDEAERQVECEEENFLHLVLLAIQFAIVNRAH